MKATIDQPRAEVAKRIYPPVAAETDLDLIPPHARVDKMQCMVGSGADLSVWAFSADDTSSEVAGAVRAPASGDGRWRKLAGGAGGSGGVDWKDSVLCATTAALAANTRTGNTLLADANGALGALDGVTPTAGTRILVKNEVASENNWIYVLVSAGGVSSKWSMTRAPDADTSAKVTPNSAVKVERGTVNADKTFELDVNEDIVLNTTALTVVDFRGLAITAPADVTKAAAAVGTSTTVARSDHKHDISTAAASGLTSASTSAEGSATSLARSDHAHAITALNGASAGTVAEKSAGALANADFGIPQVLILDVPAGVTGNIDFTGAPFAFRVIDVYARKVTTSADAGDTGALQTGAGAAISSTLALNISADDLARATSIAAANHEIAAAGTLRWRRTQSTNAACKVYVTVVRIP
jgi:hypothetical protein